MTLAELLTYGSGFKLTETGGGCTAYELAIPGAGGRYVLITVAGDPSAPEEGEPIAVGVYVEDNSAAVAMRRFTWDGEAYVIDARAYPTMMQPVDGSYADADEWLDALFTFAGVADTRA